jgi:hypothetical protein
MFICTLSPPAVVKTMLLPAGLKQPPKHKKHRWYRCTRLWLRHPPSDWVVESAWDPDLCGTTSGSQATPCFWVHHACVSDTSSQPQAGDSID